MMGYASRSRRRPTREEIEAQVPHCLRCDGPVPTVLDCFAGAVQIAYSHLYGHHLSTAQRDAVMDIALKAASEEHPWREGGGSGEDRLIASFGILMVVYFVEAQELKREEGLHEEGAEARGAGSDGGCEYAEGDGQGEGDEGGGGESEGEQGDGEEVV